MNSEITPHPIRPIQSDVRIKPIVPNGRPERLISLFGMIDASVAQKTNEALLSLASDGNDPILLHVASPGGCVANGLSIIDVMRHIEPPVFAVGSAVIASMAAVILISAERGYRYMLPHARLMLHPAAGQANGRLPEIEAITRFQREMTQELEHLVLEAAQMTRKRLRKLIQTEAYLSAREAFQLNLIDHVL